MIRYFDASAFAKRYIHSEGSRDVNRWLRAHGAATSRLTEAEISSALARRVRDGTLSARARARALDLLRSDLRRVHVVELLPAVVEGVHDLLERHPLRAADALHLAAALALHARLGRTQFVVYDQRLAEAARAERLHVLP
ncbi:MAG: type II toxin-antitoxin system VapC family toxin [Deltaproteobacteria bacterium]|nr:type II toxin-antitoxin system VapC family toxin [Deltaproteobacteria bacterium]